MRKWVFLGVLLTVLGLTLVSSVDPQWRSTMTIEHVAHPTTSEGDFGEFQCRVIYTNAIPNGGRVWSWAEGIDQFKVVECHEVWRSGYKSVGLVLETYRLTSTIDRLVWNDELARSVSKHTGLNWVSDS